MWHSFQIGWMEIAKKTATKNLSNKTATKT